MWSPGRMIPVKSRLCGSSSIGIVVCAPIQCRFSFAQISRDDSGLLRATHGVVGCLPSEDAMAELFHVGLTVKDLERSLTFYRDVAGMTAGKIQLGQSVEFDTLTNNPGARLRAVHLRAGSFMLQLLEYEAGGGTTLD